MAGFDEFGLRPELLEAIRVEGFEDPTPLQRAAIPVIRRGGNVVLRASSGAGVTAAYGAGLLDRLGDGKSGAGPRALIVAPSADRASEVAEALGGLAEGTGLRVRAIAPGWRRGPVDVLVATADAVLRGVRDSSLKLETLEVFVVDGLSTVLGLEDAETLESVAVTVGAETQRIVTTSDTNREVERFVQSHARRALEIPPRPAQRDVASAPAARGVLHYLVVSEAGKLSALAEVLGRRSESPPVVIARTVASADAVREALARRGFPVDAQAPSSEAIEVHGALDARRATVAFDVPADARVLERMESEGLVLVTARELRHLREMAEEAGFELRALERRVRRGDIASFRERVRQTLREQDIDAQLLVLDPLFDEYSAAEVAGALSAMLRSGEPEREAAAPPPPAEPSRPAPFVRLFVGVGQRDGVRPADLVGSITGEANVTGEQIGRIEIRDTFSVVEVESGVAERIIGALNGTTLRGRSLRVDFDRKTTTPRRSGGRGPEGRGRILR